jgi:hypothetical protein
MNSIFYHEKSPQEKPADFHLIDKMKKRMKKNGVVSDYLPWLLIAIAVLVIIVIAIFFMKQSGFSLIDRIKALFGGR